jgi:2-hydroxycyclohexanecarboxyl-CoA dehydrogenase
MATPLARTSALLCGGTAGIGLSTAKALVKAGVPQITLVGRSPERGAAALEALRGQHQGFAPDLRFSSHDITTPEGAEGAVAAHCDAFGKIDLLVNTGGGTGMPELFHKMPLDGLTSGLDGLLRGVMLPCRAALPHMMRRRSGVILNVASDAGKVATPGEAVIGAGMAGVMMFSRALALEAKRDGIRVNCLTPSIVRGTPLYDELMAHPFASKIFAKAEKMASLGVVEADELGELAVFLASPEAAKLSGQCISMNGGISMA